MMLNHAVIHSTAVKILEDEIQPTVQQLLSYRARLLSDLARDLLAAKAIDVPAGRKLLRDELRSIAADIRTLEPEVDADELLANPPSDGYTLEQMMAILDRR